MLAAGFGEVDVLLVTAKCRVFAGAVPGAMVWVDVDDVLIEIVARKRLRDESGGSGVAVVEVANTATYRVWVVSSSWRLLDCGSHLVCVFQVR